jgi:hypothetical protein
MIDVSVFLVIDDCNHCRGVIETSFEERIDKIEKAMPAGWHVERRTVRSAEFFMGWLLENGLAVHGQSLEKEKPKPVSRKRWRP